MVKKSGQPKQPAAIAKLKGVYRADRYQDQIQESGIIFLSKVPHPPELLNNEGVHFWNAILSEGVHIKGYIAVQDIFMFEELCYNYQMMVNAKKDIDRHGSTVIDENGHRRKSVSYLIYKESLKDFSVLCKEFGLSPSSRTGIKIVSNQNEKQAGEFDNLVL